MALSIEYGRRIDRWITELEKHFFLPLANVDLVFAQSATAIHYADRKTLEYHPIQPGDPWGDPWTYGYFQGTLTLDGSMIPTDMPEKLPLALKPETGRESLIYLQGQAAGSQDLFHFYIPLLGVQAGDALSWELFIESYAGHGHRNGHVGPNPRGEVTVPVPRGKQAVLGRTQVGLWLEPLFQLWIDVSALRDIRDGIEPDCLRQIEIDLALKQFTHTMEFEEGLPAMLNTAEHARQEFQPLFAKQNGSTAPRMYMIGHSHLDVAWKWPIEETKRKIARTFANQLSLLDQYPEYRYLNPQPYLYQILEENYPDIHARVLAEIKKGRIIPDGGMFIESDTNMPSGESLIRQFMVGKRYYRQHFGVESRICWLPDAFGYSASLPQIMAGCGIQGFTTSKILWSYNGGDPFPYITFFWQGADGSKILAHNHNEYNAHSRPSFVMNAWKTMQQKEGLRSRIMPFGYGDGGGGALREHLEFLRRQKDLEGVPRTKIAPPEEYFQDLQKDISDGYTKLPTYVGELYLQVHRGVLTTQAKTKQGNRFSEIALRELEFWTALALGTGRITLETYQTMKPEVDRLWELLLVNQFHDILPGSSIQRVHEEAEADFSHIQNSAGEMLEQIRTTLTGSQYISKEPGKPDVQKNIGVMYNSLGWPRMGLVPVPSGLTLPAEVAVQTIETVPHVMVQTAPCSLTELALAATKAGSSVAAQSASITGTTATTKADPESLCSIGPDFLENDCIRVQFDCLGQITRITDIKTGRILLSGTGNVFRMYRDVPTMFDAWDIDSMYRENPVELSNQAEIRILTQGPLAAGIEVRRTLNESTLVQRIMLAKGSRRLDFQTTVDWKETHKLLKVDFDTGIQSEQALHNIQYGYVGRPNHGTRPYDQDRYEVCAQRWSAMADNSGGVAVLNNCKYGVSVLDSVISLSLLRSPLAPDMNADKGQQTFTYGIYAWEGPLASSDLAREAYDLQVPLHAVCGTSGQGASFFQLDQPNIVLDTLKVAEEPMDSQGRVRLILRLYDMLNCRTTVRVQTPLALQKVLDSSMDEQAQDDRDEILVDYDREKDLYSFSVEVGNFQVKTLQLLVSP